MKLSIKKDPLQHFEPMKAPNDSFTVESILELVGKSKINNFYGSRKLDGIRGVIKRGELLSNSLKPIPNTLLWQYFAPIINYTKAHPDIIFEGEIYSPFHTFQELIGYTMSLNKVVDERIRFHCFDILEGKNRGATFYERMGTLEKIYLDQALKDEKFQKVFTTVPQQVITDARMLYRKFHEATEAGGEGLMLKHKESSYKYGRATVLENSFFKLKPWHTFDAVITGVVQATVVDPTAEKTINAFGYSVTSKKQNDRILIEAASALTVNWEGKELKVALASLKDWEKANFWKNRKELVGTWVEFKGMTTGAKTVPRHPLFIRLRKDKE